MVIGGGLTGIDAATEVQAYLTHIQRVYARHQALVRAWGEATVRAQFEEAPWALLQIQLGHARALSTLKLRMRMPILRHCCAHGVG